MCEIDLDWEFCAPHWADLNAPPNNSLDTWFDHRRSTGGTKVEIKSRLPIRRRSKGDPLSIGSNIDENKEPSKIIHTNNTNTNRFGFPLSKHVELKKENDPCNNRIPNENQNKRKPSEHPRPTKMRLQYFSFPHI